MSETFFEIFPVPQFLEPHYAGLALSDSSVSFVLFQKKGGDLFLKKFGRAELPVGLIEGGDIKNQEELIKFLTEFRKVNDLKFVKVGLPEEKAFLFRSSIPRMNHEEAKEALQFKIEENVPISSSESVFDFYVVNRTKEEQKVVVSVFPKKTTEEYVEVLKKSGFSPIAFETESQATAQSVVMEGNNNPVLVVSVESGRVGLFAVEKGLVQFTSTVKLEKNFFDKIEIEKSSEELQQKKEENNDGVITIHSVDNQTKSVLKDEIEKLISYWSSFGVSSNSNFKIEKIITCGDTVFLSGFKKYFSDNFDLPIEVANVWVNAFKIEKEIPDLSYEESLKYASAVGLALPIKKKKSKEKKVSKTKK